MNDPDGRYFRYSVKCDRAMSLEIDRTARRQGVSPERFVQRHFETILGQPATPDAAQVAQGQPDGQSPAAEEERASDDLLRRAAEMGISPGMLRVFDALAARADDRGIANPGAEVIAHASGYTVGSVRTLIARLASRGLVDFVRRGRGGSVSVYRIRRPG